VTVRGLVLLCLFLASVGSLAVVSLALARVLPGWGVFFFYTGPALILLLWAWRELSPGAWRRAVWPLLRAQRAIAGRKRLGSREPESEGIGTGARSGGREPTVSRTALNTGAAAAVPLPAAGLTARQLSLRLGEAPIRISQPDLLTSEPVVALVRGTIHPWLRLMRALLAVWRSPRGRRVVAAGFGLAALGTFALVARHFASVGWPLGGADLRLVAAAGALFLFAYAWKAFGWQRLFRSHERPTPLTLAAATGASSVTGVALPGRFDDVVRIAVVRRLTGRLPGVGTIVLTLFLLGLLDTAALMPFASAAAVTSEATLGIRIAFAVVAVAGVVAATLIAALPRIAASERLERYRVTRWLSQHAPASTRDVRRASILVTTGWLLRAVALLVLLAALGFGVSFPLAIAFLAAGAAAAALPIGPAGAATQAGAGAAVLASAGIGATEAVAFAVVAQTLSVLAGAAVVLVAAVVLSRRRLPRAI
jgi:uncharacterized membrane protein YbhN (UPF0104 family)